MRHQPSTKNFVKGQVVTIYCDPFTKTDPEGEATLDTFHSKDESGERWEVVFTAYPFGKYHRRIAY